MKKEAAMRAIVVYESMFGKTRRVAEAIADALRDVMEVQLLRADTARDVGLEGTDLVVVGAPTHAWGMPRPGTRKGTPNYVRKPGSDSSGRWRPRVSSSIGKTTCELARSTEPGRGGFNLDPPRRAEERRSCSDARSSAHEESDREEFSE